MTTIRARWHQPYDYRSPPSTRPRTQRAKAAIKPPPLSFTAFGPPALESSVAVPMVLTDMKPFAEYTVTMARRDRWDDKSALVRKVKLRADVRGEILFGEDDVRSLPGLGKRRFSKDE